MSKEEAADISGQESRLTPAGEAVAEFYRTKLRNAKENSALALRETTEAAETAAARQTEELREQLRDTQKQLYRDYMGGKKELEQKLSAQGYTGGLAESSRVRMEAGYGEQLNANEQERLRQENRIAAETGESIRKAQSDAARANASAEQDYYSSLASLAEKEYSRAMTDERDRADKLAANGDFFGYLELGFTQEETDYLLRVWLKKNPELKSTWLREHKDTAKRLGIS